jgi:hypothetical protein
MPSDTSRVTLDGPSEEIDLDAWLFGLSDADYQACARGHRGAGVFTDEHGRGMINVESIGGNLIVQHYRCVRAGRSSVEMYSPSSRVYLFHLVPFKAGVRWTLDVTPRAAGGSELACTVQVDLPPILRVLARLTFLGHFLGRHVEEEALGFAADITRKRFATSGGDPDALQRDRQEQNPTEVARALAAQATAGLDEAVAEPIVS